jgi:hypothetical protein
MWGNKDGKHHGINDRLAEADFESFASQRRCALAFGPAMAGCDLESARDTSALGSFNVVGLVANEPRRLKIDCKRGRRLQ